MTTEWVILMPALPCTTILEGARPLREGTAEPLRRRRGEAESAIVSLL